MYDVVIIGAGASGLMCALSAKLSNKNLNILLLEKNSKIGKKILITGNGRCNLGNTNISLENYNNNLLYDFKEEIESNNYLDILKQTGLIIKEDNSGRLYPYSMQSLTVCKAFTNTLKKLGVKIKCDYEVSSICKNNDIFIINNDIKAKKVVVATGGKTYPKTGSTGIGYRILKSFGHEITALYPSLTSLKTDYKHIKSIAGVRFDSKVSLVVNGEKKKEEHGQIQFTSDSVSGICVFNLSREVGKYLDNKKSVKIVADLIPEYTFEEIKKHFLKFRNHNVIDLLSEIINDKLAGAIVKELELFEKKIDELSTLELDVLINMIKEFTFNIVKTGDFESSQVTTGGASLNEFYTTLESKKTTGLYATGEVLDVDGDCGGYNLAWAFTSGMIVGKSIAVKEDN